MQTWSWTAGSRRLAHATQARIAYQDAQATDDALRSGCILGSAPVTFADDRKIGFAWRRESARLANGDEYAALAANPVGFGTLFVPTYGPIRQIRGHST